MKKLVNKIGVQGVGINIYDCQPYHGNCHLFTEISKRRTNMHTTVVATYKQSSNIRLKK